MPELIKNGESQEQNLNEIEWVKQNVKKELDSLQSEVAGLA